uniref:Uncharacterized protein n=1 Tax=Kalanchoe fedtschenkoi TaxID=63787 RepID=A0A7N0SXE7_KALFE
MNYSYRKRYGSDGFGGKRLWPLVASTQGYTTASQIRTSSRLKPFWLLLLISYRRISICCSSTVFNLEVSAIRFVAVIMKNSSY